MNNRITYFNLCEEKLSFLCTRVELRGSLNITDAHLHCEDFYAHLLNLLFGYNLINANKAIKNASGLDLIDHNNRIIIQSSATATRRKIESSLSKLSATYAGYRYKFLSISKDASNLRLNSYKNPHGLIFKPSDDIIDVQSILKEILHFDIVKQREVYGFLRSEIGAEEVVPTETNLAEIIKFLAKEDFNSVPGSGLIPFSIDDKIEFNTLIVAADVVDDYKIHYYRVDKVYSEFDAMGFNKSVSVLSSLRASYFKLSRVYTGDDLFFRIVDQIIFQIRDSANYALIPLEELEMCVNMLVVNAFIRCKIFKNPRSVSYAAS